MNLQGYKDGTVDEVQVGRTEYVLKSFEKNLLCVMHQRKTWYCGSECGRFALEVQIDGAALPDTGLQLQTPYSNKPGCLLGMDFITEYPYLLYVPRFNLRGIMAFVIARDLFTSRHYSIQEQFYKTTIVYVDGHHNEDTGNIGCGIFFRPGSVFNISPRVSKYNGDQAHNFFLKERGILMAIIKTLHVVRAFPVGRDFREVVIRSTNPAIVRLMAVTQVTMRNVFTDSKKGGKDDFDPLGSHYYPTVNRDLMLYFCHYFGQDLGSK